MKNSTKHSPSVTWLLPVKNGMPYLPDTLASIAAQTCGDYQVLAWDNGSTDTTIEELRSWIPSRLPGRVVVDRPAGLGASLAMMVEASKTEFCARIDADDVNFPSRLETQLGFLRDNPEVAAVGSQVVRIDEAGREYGQHYALPLKHGDIVQRMLHAWVMWHPTVLFRRQAVLDVGNYRNWDPLIEDYDLWMRLAVKHELANIDACLVKYRLRDSGATNVAIRNGTLEKAIQKCFVMNAPRLFGCSEAEAAQLRTDKTRAVTPLLMRAARYLCQTQGGKLEDRLRSASWKIAVRELTKLRA
jgi:glycosyltransferase involved in cell wall biosynthesis